MNVQIVSFSMQHPDLSPRKHRRLPHSHLPRMPRLQVLPINLEESFILIIIRMLLKLEEERPIRLNYLDRKTYLQL